jgi:hypothetical protein
LTELAEEELRDITGGRLSQPDLANTGCTGAAKATCGIVMCSIAEM